MSSFVKLDNVSLRFVLHRHKRRTLKDAVLGWLVGRPRLDGPKNIWVLRDVSLGFEAGDRVGVIGRNGAGKSTLLRVIAKIYKPTCGTVTRDGFLCRCLRRVRASTRSSPRGRTSCKPGRSWAFRAARYKT